MLLGVGIGAGAVLTGRHLQAQSQVGVGAARLVITPAALSGSWVHTDPMTWVGKTPPLQFIKDTKSGGCWIGNVGDNGVFVSIAMAPASACD